jgi:hypothetical protein
MADELQLRAVLDATGVVTGFEVMSSAAKNSTEQMQASFAGIQASEESVTKAAASIAPAIAIATDAIKAQAAAAAQLKAIQDSTGKGSSASIAASLNAQDAAAAQRAALANLGALANPAEGAALTRVATDAQIAYNEAIAQQRIASENAAEGSVARIAADEQVAATREALAAAQENLNKLQITGAELLTQYTAAQAELNIQTQQGTEYELRAADAYNAVAIAAEKAATAKEAAGIAAAKEEVILSDSAASKEAAAYASGVGAAKEEPILSDTAAQVQANKDAKAALAAQEAALNEELQQSAQYELQAAEAMAGTSQAAKQTSISIAELEANVTKAQLALDSLRAARISTPLISPSDVGITGKDIVPTNLEQELAATDALTEAKQRLAAARAEAASSPATEGVATETTETITLTQAQNNLATATTNLKAIAADSSTSWYEYAAAEQAVASASDEVAAIQAASSQRIATAKVSLAAAQAEETEVLSNSNASWAEAAEARLNVVAAEGELQAALASSGDVASAATAGSASLAAAEADAAEAATAAAAAAESYHISLSQADIGTKSLRVAIDQLNSVTSAEGAQLESLSNEFDKVAARAQKLGLALVDNGRGYTLIKAGAVEAKTAVEGLGNATVETTGKLDAMSSGIAFATGRMVAMDVGAGQLSYTFGLLGRAIPSVGAALNVVFLPILAITFADIISNLVDKFTKLEESIRKTEYAYQELGFEAQRDADQIGLTNLKLEDTIAKLQGKVEPNAIAVAAIEGKLAVDRELDSIDKLLEKQQELASSKEIGYFSIAHFAGGAEPTTLEEQLIAPYREALREKLEIQREANLTGTKEEQTAAAADVETARAAAEGKAQQYVNAIRAKIDADKEYEKTHVTLADQTDYAPLLKKAESELKAFQSIRPQEEAVAQTPDLTNAAAKARQAEEAYARLRASQEVIIKDTERAGEQKVAVEKQTATLAFQAAELGAKQQVLLANESGTLRAQAQLDSIPKLAAAQRTINQAELDELDEGYRNKAAKLQADRDLDAQNPNAEKRKNALQTDDDAILAEYNKYTAERNNLELEGQNRLIQIQNGGDQQRLEIARANAEKIAKEFREAEKLTLETGNLQLKGINESIRAEERLYSLGEVSRSSERAFLAQKITALQQQEAIARAAIEANISKEVAQQKPGGTFAPGAISELSVNSNSLATNTDAIKQNTTAILSPKTSATSNITGSTGGLNDVLEQVNQKILEASARAGATGATTGGSPEVTALQAQRAELLAALQTPATPVASTIPAEAAATTTPATEIAFPPAAVSAAADQFLQQLQATNPPTTAPTAAPATGTGGALNTSDTTAYAASLDRVKNLQEQLAASDERWKAAIDQVTASFEKLDTSTSTWMLKFGTENQNLVDNFLNQWQTQLVTLNNGFASAFDGWLAHGKSFGQAIANVGVKMLEDFSNSIIQIGLRIAELNVVSLLRGQGFAGLGGGLPAADTLKGPFIPGVGGVPNAGLGAPSAIGGGAAVAAPVVPPSVVGGAASVPSTLGGAAEQAQQTAAVTAAQAQQTAATAAGEAQRQAIQTTGTTNAITQTGVVTTAHATGETTKTTATTAGTASRGAVQTAGTVNAVTQTGVVVAAHVAGEQVKTGTTLSGELNRAIIRTANFIHEMALTTARVAAHVAGEVAKTLATAAGATIRGLIETAEAIASIAKRAASAAAGAFSAMASIPYIGPILGAAAAAAALATVLALSGHFAEGGRVSGAGSGTSDSIPAMLSHGEFVVNAAATSKHLGTLQAINTGKFASGGYVTPNFHFAAGGQAFESRGAQATNDSHDVNRFQFHNEINGANKSTEEMGEEIWNHFRGKLRRSGYNI